MAVPVQARPACQPATYTALAQTLPGKPTGEPNIRELWSLFDARSSPSLNIEAFPNSPAAFYSSACYQPGLRWIVYFGDVVESSNGVQFVRGDQGLMDIVRSTSDYVDNGDGTANCPPT
jgi:hypothetical protein